MTETPSEFETLARDLAGAGFAYKRVDASMDDIETFAEQTLDRVSALAPTDVQAGLRDDIRAGWFLTALIELIEQAPDVVPADTVDAFEPLLSALPECGWRLVGLKAIRQYRSRQAS